MCDALLNALHTLQSDAEKQYQEALTYLVEHHPSYLTVPPLEIEAYRIVLLKNTIDHIISSSDPKEGMILQFSLARH